MKVSFYSYSPRISFGTMRMDDAETGKPIDSDFFRDLPTQKHVAKLLDERFPHGQDVLIYANSCGEDSYSLALLMNNNPRHRIRGFDISENAYKIFTNGKYALHEIGYDSFLMNSAPEKTNIEQRVLKRNFDKYFKYAGVDSRGYEIRNYAGGLNNVVYEPLECGDIRGIKNIPVGYGAGAVFFRNSFFHLIKHDKNFNQFLSQLYKKPDDFDYILYKNTPTEKEYNDFKMQVNEIIGGVYNKLSYNGVFVMGNIVQEHYFLPPAGYKGKTVPFLSTPLGEQISEIVNDKSDLHNRKFITALRKVRVIETSPIVEALEKDARFMPIFYSNIQSYPGVYVPTVWEKCVNIQSC